MKRKSIFRLLLAAALMITLSPLNAGANGDNDDVTDPCVDAVDENGDGIPDVIWAQEYNSLDENTDALYGASWQKEQSWKNSKATFSEARCRLDCGVVRSYRHNKTSGTNRIEALSITAATDGAKYFHALAGDIVYKGVSSLDDECYELAP